MESLRGYDEWKTTEPIDPVAEAAREDGWGDDGCPCCGKDCRRSECDTCGRVTDSVADCTEEVYCSPICAAAGGL